jgi:hypothetical protein
MPAAPKERGERQIEPVQHCIFSLAVDGGDPRILGP